MAVILRRAIPLQWYPIVFLEQEERMRKKSHVSLGKYIVDSLDCKELKFHKKAFLVGSVLPDCKPSFLTRKHEFDETYEWLKESICELTQPGKLTAEEGQAYWRKMGEVIHYIADYFTYPHNFTFTGTLREHCDDENELKFCLRYYIHGGRAKRNREMLSHREFADETELFSYIEKCRAEYLKMVPGVETDARYITAVSLQVMRGMYQLLIGRLEEESIEAA